MIITGLVTSSVNSMKPNKKFDTNPINRFRAIPINTGLVVTVPTPCPWDDHAFEAVLDQGRVIAHTPVSRGRSAPCLHGAAKITGVLTAVGMDAN